MHTQAYIYSYTRQDALEDGSLIDVTTMAKEAGFKFPVAVTSAVWNGYIQPSSEAIGQSINGRLWDTLCMAAQAGKKVQGGMMFFSVIFVLGKDQLKTIKFKSIIGPGDCGEPVITIMLPNEN